MNRICLYFLFLLLGSRSPGQSATYTMQQIAETVQTYGKTETSTLDTTVYRMSVTAGSEQGPYNIELSLQRYSCRVKVRSDAYQLVNYYYSTQKKMQNSKYQIAFDNLDASTGALRGLVVKTIFDPGKDTLYVLNADSIVQTLSGVPPGLRQNVMIKFSDDYFTGFFNAFLHNGFMTHHGPDQSWTQQKEMLSAPNPRNADRNYKTISVNGDSIQVAVTGTSTYRNPKWTYAFEGPQYCTGTEEGTIIYRTQGFIPWRMDMNYQFKTPKNRYSDYDELTTSQIRIRFIQELK